MQGILMLTKGINIVGFSAHLCVHGDDLLGRVLHAHAAGCGV